jgi:hypothetical protein
LLEGRSVTRPFEVGGEFHWMDWPRGRSVSWPEPNMIYALGRDALLGLWRHLERSRRVRRLFVPDYFCQEVTDAWRSDGIPLVRYADNPGRHHPRWGDLDEAGAGDAVLIVNYFGVRSPGAWAAWEGREAGAMIVEDHTHDPISTWARHSQADYAFASLRKTLPVPDGAVLWSPQGHDLPDAPPAQASPGSALKLAAMVLKREYLAGCREPGRTKEMFRGLQVEGEHLLAGTRSSAATTWGRTLLASGYPPAWRQKRERNVRQLLDLVPDRESMRPLFREWSRGACPLAVTLVCATHEERERVRLSLLAADIYPTILWRLGREGSRDARELSRRVLCLPADQRYRRSDLERVAAVLSEVDGVRDSSLLEG